MVWRSPKPLPYGHPQYRYNATIGNGSLEFGGYRVVIVLIDAIVEWKKRGIKPERVCHGT